MLKQSSYSRLLGVAALLLPMSNAFGQQLALPTGSGPSNSGPVTTPGTATFSYNNTSTSTFSAYTPATTVSISFSNQQFTSGPTPGMTAGSKSGSSSAALASTTVFQPTSNIGAPSASEYTSTPFGTAGTGYVTNSIYGFWLFTDASYLDTAGAGRTMAPLDGRYYYGNLTITFSRPVLNPVLHFAGLGAGNSFNVGSNYLGFYTEFNLSPANISAGYSLTKLSGSTYFSVTDSSIENSSLVPTTLKTASYYASQAVGNSASGGSVRVNTNGAEITSITLKVYLRGDGGYGTLNEWAGSVRSGDAYLITTTLGTYSISGNIYNDANGMGDGKVNGTLTNLTGLYANLIDANGNLYASKAVTGGTYSFTNVVGGNYKVVLTTSATATAAALPATWSNTGENIGTAAGSDGLVDGKLSVSVGKSATETNVTNANFGMKQVSVMGVELKEFSVNTNGCDAHLDWQTATEKDMAAFEIQYSNTGEVSNYTTVLATSPRGSNSHYTATYNQPIANAYYRLKMVSQDGSFTLSKVVSARTTCDNIIQIKAYPNPTDGAISVTGVESGTQLTLYDLQGQIVHTSTSTGSMASLDLSSLAPGLYQLAVIDKNVVQQRIAIIKK